MRLLQVQEQIQLLFNLSQPPSDMFTDSKCTSKAGNNLKEFEGQTIYLKPSNGNQTVGSCCPFINIRDGKNEGCFLIENPKGCKNHDYVQDVLQTLFSKPVKKLDNNAFDKVQWSKVTGRTLNAS